MRLIDRSALAGLEALALAKRAYAIAPWLKDVDLTQARRPRLVARDGEHR